MTPLLDRHDTQATVIMITLLILVCVLLVVLLGGCSSYAERLDQRPAICKELGKRGAEC